MKYKILIPLLAFLLWFTVSTRAEGYEIIDFDALTPGDPVATIGNVTFSSNTGLDLIASNVFDTSSGDNYLGVDDGGFESFLPSFGDEIYLDFTIPVLELSVNFISTPFPPEEYTIETPEGSALSGFTPSATLGDGGEVYNVSFTSATPFSSATLKSVAGDVHSFNVDDISYDTESSSVPVPEPTTIAMIGAGMAGLIWYRRRKGGGQIKREDSET